MSYDRRHVQLEIRAILLGSVLHTATQIAHIGCPWPERFQRLLSIPVSALPLFIICAYPKFYTKYRDIILFVFRVLFFSFPLLRKAKGIQRVLEAPATPGVLGWLTDTIKILWGMRLFTLIYFSISAFPQQSILLYFLGQAFGAAILRSNASLCKTPLLSDPLTLHRLRIFNVFSISVITSPEFPNLIQDPIDQQRFDCSFFISVLTVAVVTVPTTASIASSRKLLDCREMIVCWFGCIVITLLIALLLTSELFEYL